MKGHENQLYSLQQTHVQSVGITVAQIRTLEMLLNLVVLLLAHVIC